MNQPTHGPPQWQHGVPGAPGQGPGGWGPPPGGPPPHVGQQAGVRIIEGQPGIPVVPDFTQRAGFLLLWAAMLLLPLTMVIVRFVYASAAWLTLLFLAWGVIGIIIGQAVLAGIAISQGRGWASNAIGYRAVIASLAYYAAWILVAWGLNDWGGQSGILLSPLGERVGPEMAGWVDLGLIALVVGTAVALIVFIVLDGKQATRRAHEAFRSLPPGGRAGW